LALDFVSSLPGIYFRLVDDADGLREAFCPLCMVGHVIPVSQEDVFDPP
jgi:hypothetical protein